MFLLVPSSNLDQDQYKTLGQQKRCLHNKLFETYFFKMGSSSTNFGVKITTLFETTTYKWVYNSRLPMYFRPYLQGPPFHPMFDWLNGSVNSFASKGLDSSSGWIRGVFRYVYVWPAVGSCCVYIAMKPTQPDVFCILSICNPQTFRVMASLNEWVISYST